MPELRESFIESALTCVIEYQQSTINAGIRAYSYRRAGRRYDAGAIRVRAFGPAGALGVEPPARAGVKPARTKGG